MSLFFEDEDIPRAKQSLSLQPQHTSAEGSFSEKAKHFSSFLILLRLCRSYLQMTFLIHILLLIFSFRLFYFFLPPCPSFLLPAAPSVVIVTGWSSRHAHISRCLILQKCFSEELAFSENVQDRAESNIVGHFVTSPPERKPPCI